MALSNVVANAKAAGTLQTEQVDAIVRGFLGETLGADSVLVLLDTGNRLNYVPPANGAGLVPDMQMADSAFTNGICTDLDAVYQLAERRHGTRLPIVTTRSRLERNREYLKRLDIAYSFYTGRYIDKINDLLDPAVKTIVHIPNVNSRESTKDKHREVEEIMDHLGRWVGTDLATGFQLIETAEDRTIKVADLVDDGSFVEYGSFAIAAQRRRRELDDLIRNTPGDGLVGGLARVNGAHFPGDEARVAVASYDYTVLAGTQGQKNHTKKDRLFDVAERLRLPEERVRCVAPDPME